MWIKRTISDYLTSLAASRPALVVSGARQVGKTSLLKQLFERHHFVTLDLPAAAAQAESMPEEFLQLNPPPVLIDEIQYAPGIFRHLKIDIDRHRKDYGRFILTGSQKFPLMKEVSDSLAGRVAIVDLETLSYREIRSSFPDINLETILLRGGYPELWEDRRIDYTEFYRAYLATYLERDVRSLLAVGSLRDFERFVRACALRSAQLLNKSDLARDVGISPVTAGQWISVLAASNQIALLEPWFSNRTKSIVKTPKIYWHDAGFMAYLIGIRTEQDLLLSPFKGAIWETFIYSEMRKRLVYSDLNSSLFFWRDRNVEVDFIIDRGGRFELFDAKWSENPDNADSRSMLLVSKVLGEKNVITRNLLARPKSPYQMKDGIWVLSCESKWREDEW